MSELSKNPTFEEVAEYLLQKNAELYRRLAQGVPKQHAQQVPAEDAVVPDHEVEARPENKASGGCQPLV